MLFLLGLIILNMVECKYKHDIENASSIALFRSLINHSCVANVNFVSIDNKLVTVVVSPVKAGEQLFHSYYAVNGPDHALFREVAMELFGFECDCQKCIDKSHEYIPIQVVDPMRFTTRKSFEPAKEILKDGWNFINAGVKAEDLILFIGHCLTILRIIS